MRWWGGGGFSYAWLNGVHMPLRKWLTCPSCEGDDTGVLAFQTTMVVECYDCGEVEEFEFGEDVPVHELDLEEATSGGS